MSVDLWLYLLFICIHILIYIYIYIYIYLFIIIIWVLFADVFHNVHKKTPVLESLSNKVTGLKACNFIQQRLQHKCFPVNTAKYLRRAFFFIFRGCSTHRVFYPTLVVSF